MLCGGLHIKLGLCLQSLNISFISYVSQEIPVSKGTEGSICSDGSRARIWAPTAQPNPSPLRHCGWEGQRLGRLLAEHTPVPAGKLKSHEDQPNRLGRCEVIWYFSTASV